MTSFLDTLLDEMPGWQTQPESLAFILPSKRAGFFLKNRMAQKAGGTQWVPDIWSIEDFVSDVAGLRYAPLLHSLFRLYEVYNELHPGTPEPFADFAKWAPTLLQDYNETDRYLVDAHALFTYLTALKELRQWMPEGQTTELIERRTAFWRRLGPVYERFRKSLLAEGMGYQGQVYREAVSELPAYLENTPGKTFVFAGFNALNAAEDSLIQQVLEAGRGVVFWDADTHYLENPLHDAGLFLRRYRAQWPGLKKTLRGTGAYLQTPKEIHLIGVPKAVSQARYCGRILEELQETGPEAIRKTALVLGDESLLNPLLHSIPKDIPTVNITMGYPLNNVPLAPLFRQLFRLWEQYDGKSWRIHSLLDLISNPFLRPWFTACGYDPEKTRSRILVENTIRATPETLTHLGVPAEIQQHLFPPGAINPPRFIALGQRLILELKSVALRLKDKMVLEYLRHFYRIFNQLSDLCAQYAYVNTLQALELLFEQVVTEGQLDFQGEPLEGLQLMGMLESRNLDFDTVILTSVNEGILPSGKTQQSFIPFDVKKAYGLPTYKEKDAIYTYHFYRLLQRARRVFILYNTQADVLEGGEPSRFIEQLRTDPQLSPFIQERMVVPDMGQTPQSNVRIAKDAHLLSRLAELGSSGFSPTSLSRYIKDPMEFYRRNILKIPESETLEETVAANTFGTVLHHALEKLYNPWKNKILTAEGVEDMIRSAPGQIHQAFTHHYLKKGQPHGKNLIALHVLEQQLIQYLEQERHLIQNHQVEILGVEDPVTRIIPIPGLDFEVRLKGILDRVERVDGQLRIIDYKSGSVLPSDLRIDAWDTLCSDPKRAKAFQLLCYAWMYGMPADAQPLKAGIVSFRNLQEGRQWFGLRGESRYAREFLEIADLDAFEAQLHRLILELFSTEVPFAPADS